MFTVQRTRQMSKAYHRMVGIRTQFFLNMYSHLHQYEDSDDVLL
jgi:hypothetical protein